MHTHCVKSSEQIESQRSNEEFFMRIPLKALGGFGISGRLKLQTSVEIVWWDFMMAFNNPSSVISAPKSSEEHLRWSHKINKKIKNQRNVHKLVLTLQYRPPNCPKILHKFTQTPASGMLTEVHLKDELLDSKT